MSAVYPPGPKPILFGLNVAARFRSDPIGFGRELARYDSDILHYALGPVHGYLVKHPDLVHEVLVKQAKKVQKWTRQKQIFGKFNGNGLVNSDGDFWRRQRKLVQPAFHSRRIAGYADIMVDYTRRHLAAWPVGEDVRIEQLMSRLTRDIVAKTLFNADVSAETEQISAWIDIVQHMGYRDLGAPFVLPDWVPLPSKRREVQAIRDLDAVIMRIIHERRASGADAGDLLSMLLLAVDDQGSGMTDQQASDELMTLFIAGHETSATALTWAWYLLAAHPEAMAKLQDEVNTVLRDRPATFEDVSRLRYAEMVIREAMRLYPPTYLFPRQVAETMELGGYTLQPGTLIHLFPYLMHHDARWFPQPERFDPERFAPGRVEQIPDYAYFPFGGGPRVCIGNSFAIMEMQLILATVLQHYQVSLAAGQGEPELEQLLVLRPKGGVRLRLSPRVARREAASTEYATT